MPENLVSRYFRKNSCHIIADHMTPRGSIPSFPTDNPEEAAREVIFSLRRQTHDTLNGDMGLGLGMGISA